MSKLPPGVKSLTEIRKNTNSIQRVREAKRLLEFLLNAMVPTLQRRDGSDAFIGDRVQHLAEHFSNIADVMFAIGIRNKLDHPKVSEAPPPPMRSSKLASILSVPSRTSCPTPPIALQRWPAVRRRSRNNESNRIRSPKTTYVRRVASDFRRTRRACNTPATSTAAAPFVSSGASGASCLPLVRSRPESVKRCPTHAQTGKKQSEIDRQRALIRRHCDTEHRRPLQCPNRLAW